MRSTHNVGSRGSRIATAIGSIVCMSAAGVTACGAAISTESAHVEVISRADLGEIDRGWWHALYTASFAEPGSAGHLVAGALRLFSYDVVQPGGTFALHSHDNVEVITVVLEGSFDHVDTAGNSGRADAGDVMLMSAGRGVEHAEQGNVDALTRVVTIWLEPRDRNTEPRHDIQHAAVDNAWQVIAAERDALLIVDQDVRVSIRRLAPGEHVSLEALAGRMVYLGIVEGELLVNDRRVAVPERIIARNGQFNIASDSGATVVLIDLQV